MSTPAKARGPSEHPEWDAYVREVRDHAASREIEYIGRFTKLEPTGGGVWKGCSPFRPEKSPSFQVWENGGGCFDFGIAEGGDLIFFVRKREGVGFREALDTLARDFGLGDWETRKRNRGAPGTDPASLASYIETESAAERVFACCTWIAYVCHRLLPSSVREHLVHHYGYSEAFIDAQKIGWCPEALWEVLHADGEARPFTDEEILATGWFFPTADGGHAALAGRIVFPYWKNGQARYAIGREHHGGALKSDVNPLWYEERQWDLGKYKKLPVYNEKHPWISPAIRNDVLWGEDTLRVARDGTLGITEGVTDAGIIAMLGFAIISPVTVTFRNDDVEHVVASLRRYRPKRVVILNDNDTDAHGKHPGLDGAKRMAAKLWAEGFDVRIARLPKPEGVTKIDVNEIVAAALARGGEEHAKAVVQDLLDSALPYPEFLLSEIPANAPHEDLEKVLRDLGALCARLSIMAQIAFTDRVLARFPRLPKAPARKVFRQAAMEAAAKASADAAAAAPADGSPAPAATPGTARKPPTIRGRVVEHADGFYERENAIGERERISNFRLTLLKRIAGDRLGPAAYCVRVEGVDTGWASDGLPVTFAREWVVAPKAWVSAKAFLALFPSERMVWTGTDAEVQGVVALLAESYDRVPLVRSTGVLGRHAMPDGTLRFVVPAGTFGADGKWMADADLVYLPDGGSNLQHRLPTEKGDLEAAAPLAREVLESLLLLHEPEAMGAMAGWFAASLFGPFLRHRLGVFSILNIAATPGSGKTSLLQRVLWPAFAGVVRGELLSCTSTAFVYARDFASSNALPLVLDEFKTADMGKAVEPLVRALRRLYSGDTETRGRADQDVNVYIQLACVCLAGEHRPEGDQAMNERCVFVTLDGNWLGRHPDARALFERLSQKPIAQVAPLFQSWSLRTDADKLLARAAAYVGDLLAKLDRGEIPSRVRLNLTLVAFGAFALDELATSLGTRVADYSLAAVLSRLLAETFDEDADGKLGTRVRDYFDDVYCAGAEMANLGVIKEGKEYAWVDGKLRLWMPGLLAALNVWRASQRLAGGAPDARALRRIAREKAARGDSYVLAVGVRSELGDGQDDEEGRRVRCVEVDPARVPASFEAESYPADSRRTWGGKRAPSAQEMMDRFHRSAKREPN